MSKRTLTLLFIFCIFPVAAYAYILTKKPNAEELKKLPLFTQTSSFTHSDYGNRLVRFRIYIREIGPLANLRAKTLLLAHPEQGKLFESPVDYNIGRRQSIPSLDFVVDESCMNESYLKLRLPHYQGGDQEYQINLKILFEENKLEDIDSYVVSGNPAEEKNPRFRKFLTLDYEPWDIPLR